jgi:NADPH-dependent ferric siderophore reductase
MTAYPLPDRLKAIAGVQPLELEVAEVSDLGPRMRRIQLTGDSLSTFSYLPGQDVMLLLGMADDRPLSRRYTIRSFDPQTHMLELNLVAHGIHGLGATWAANARPGDRVNGVGPRGKITLNPTAEWHLFAGDESAAPGILNMLEALAPEVPGFAFLEVNDPRDELPTTVGANGTHRVQWLYRGETPVIHSTLLEEAVSGAELPAGRGHVYFAGEVQRVAAIQRAALGRGLAQEQLSPKSYWGRGKPNAARGEPD